ncbi:hypothetical protein V1283_008729 [Bradyrhizobium sp. AZCC 2262]|uniref:hypothetical protein n=1 Tax=Bradyrhizobium sp. AZCC 2262 TaxID=3117022 RepID=UPI002FF3CF5E
MGAIVRAQYTIGAHSHLTREQVDKIIEVLNITDEYGHLIKPPVGPNCTYLLVLEKAVQDVPMEDGNNSS